MSNFLPLPPFFNEATADQLRLIKYQDIFQSALDWKKKYGVLHYAMDKFKIGFLEIDRQVSFCLPSGELFVGGRSGKGALEDSIRSARFIYRNLRLLTELSFTMDTHQSKAIFLPEFWIDENGNNPAVFTNISFNDVQNGKWRPNPAVAKFLCNGDYHWLQAYTNHYTKQLADGGRYSLVIWPYHTMLGGAGHVIVPIVEEAAFFHSVTRHNEIHFEIKGGIDLTENYSVFKPEVLTSHDSNRPVAQKNSLFLEQLMRVNLLAIGGEAGDYCVSWSIDDMLNEIKVMDPSLTKKVYILEDLISPVVIPGVYDGTDAMKDSFSRFEAAGMHVVKSTDPIKTWPGVKELGFVG